MLIVDTNIFSFIFRGHSLAALFGSHLIGQDLAISFMSLAEMYEWGITRNWGPVRWDAFQVMLAGYVIPWADDVTCRRWADVRHERRKQPISESDAWIAATALVQGADLVTHNPSDFQGVSGLNIVTEAP